MYVEIVEFISKCTKCAQEKPATTQTRYWVNLPKFAFHTVSIDIVGPFPTSNVGNRILFVAIDKLTKWVETLASPNTTAKVTAKFLLQHIIFRHSCPQKFLTNNGTNFTARIIPELNKLMGIGTHYTTPYHPQANGLVEQTNGTLTRIVRKLAEETGLDWDTIIPEATFAYNIGFYFTTKFLPSGCFMVVNLLSPPYSIQYFHQDWIKAMRHMWLGWPRI